MSYASNRIEDYRQLGVYAAKIIDGTKPADLPVIQPSKLELVIQPQNRPGAWPPNPGVAGASRQGDRIVALCAAVHMSPLGT
jgi:hypothetical protein